MTEQIEKLPEHLDAVWQAITLALEKFSNEAQTEARWLFQHVGFSPQDRRWQPHKPLSEVQYQFLTEALRRRQQREPLQHILGTQAFRHLELVVNAHVLIPRPETEELVERVLAYIHTLPRNVHSPLRVLDVGTGSGAIALALKTECPSLEVWASDLSFDALQVARLNAQRVSAQLHFRQGDGLFALEDGLKASFDVLVSNPPYIPPEELAGLEPEVRDHEPTHALVPQDPDPLYFYRHFAAEAPRFLRPGARAFFEIHSALGPQTQACFQPPVWCRTEVHTDFSQRPRFVEAWLAADLNWAADSQNHDKEGVMTCVS